MLTTHSEIAYIFQAGNFPIHKINWSFSTISVDKAYKQNNVVKGDGGAVGQNDIFSALGQWMVPGPRVARSIQQFPN